MSLLVFPASVTVAALSAGGSVLERLAAATPNARDLFSRSFTYRVFKRRLFLQGLGLQLLGAAAEIVALSSGPLIVVEPILTLDLVFLLLFIHMKVHVKIGLAEWLAAGAIIIGLSCLFIIARPSSGRLDFSSPLWSLVLGIFTAACLLTIAAVRRLRSQTLRTILVSVVTATTYALNAAITQLALAQFRQGGLSAVFTNWPVYILIVSGIASIYLMQNAFSAGPLAISQPVIEITTPIVGVVIGIVIYRNSFSHYPLALAGEAVCLAVIVWGVFTLARSENIHQASGRGL